MINGLRKDRRVSLVDKQYDYQEGFFKHLTTDFKLMVLRLSDSWRRRRAGPKHESAWYSKFKKFNVIFNKGSWVSMRSNEIEVEERHQLKTLLAVLWRISN